MGDDACMMRHLCPRCGRVHDAHDPATECREEPDATTDRSVDASVPPSSPHGHGKTDET